MADMLTLMNTILANASTEYVTRVPVATQANITAVGDPILNYSSTQNEFLSALVNRIALVLVRNKILKNPLRVLKQGGIPLGNDIQEIFTNPAAGTAYDPTGATLLTRVIPDTYAIYHRKNREGQYTVTVSKDQLRTAFTAWDKLEELLNSIVNSLYSGDNYDEFILMKNLFADAITAGKIVTVEVPEIIVPGASTAFVKAVRNASGLMQFPSSNFNTYSTLNPPANPIITWTPKEDQILLLRTDIATEIDVDVLAVAFNMDKASLLSRVLEVDSFGAATDCYGILCDKSFPQIYDNLVEMTEFYNAKGMYWNYFWNHWQTYSLSMFANAVAFMKPVAIP